MTKDVALQLGALARDRSDGRLTLADYRKLRAPLLDVLVSRNADDIDESSLITRPRAFVRSPELQIVAVGARRPRVTPWMLSALVLACLIVVVMGMRSWSSQTSEGDTPIEPMRVSVTAAVASTPTRSPDAEPRPSVKPAKSVSKTSGSCQFTGAGARVTTCEDRLATREVGPRLYVVPALKGAGAFAVSAQAISQMEFRAYCEQAGRPCPSQPWVDDNDPVVNVTWDEARDYARWLSKSTGQSYRLPTEAEWLQAVRILDRDEGFSAGKVREWTDDAWPAEPGLAVNAPDQRVVRGASYADDSTTVLSARRNRVATIRDALTGFRAVREIR